MAELSDADKEFIKELREAKENKSITRREALSVAGGVLGGGALGAAGAVETASADASTTDSDGNVGLPDDRVDVFAEGVDTGEVNNVLWAAPGELQEKIDLAATGFIDSQTVAMYPGAYYETNATIDVKESVCLQPNSAAIIPQGDHDAIFFDRGTRLDGYLYVRTKGVTGYTSNAVVLDTVKAGGRYNSTVRDQVEMSGGIFCNGTSGEGTGLYLNSDTDPITLGNVIRVSVNGFTDAMHLRAVNTGYINASDIHFTAISYSGAAIRHTGGEPANPRIWGTIQADGNYGIINESTASPSAEFAGNLFDPQNFTNAAFDGKGITLKSTGDLLFSQGNAGVGTTLNGIGQETANAEVPQSSEWVVGEWVDFTDSGDGSGDGLYLYDPTRSWRGPL